MIFSILTITTVSLSLLGAYLLEFFYRQNLENKTSHLAAYAVMLETSLEEAFSRADGASQIARQVKKIGAKTDLRITILDDQGEVVADSWENAERLDNHMGRVEVQKAIASPYSSVIRYSFTIKQNMFYVAVPAYIEGRFAGIVRTASTLAPIEREYQKTRDFILFAIFVTMLAAAVFGAWLSHLYARPIVSMTRTAQKIADGAWRTRIDLKTGDELEALARTINCLTSNLEEKLLEIDAEAKKSALILAHMDNAVLLLDRYGNVTTANQTAQELFRLSPELMGRHSIGVIGNSILTETAQEVLDTRQSKSISLKMNLDHAQKTFQIFFAPILHQKETVSGVLSVFHDISFLQEIYDRQVEFVANASHELKTPLTAIQGFSETLLDGALGDPSLCEKFVKIIYAESKRMSRLVQELLQLAKLDTAEYRKQVKLEPVDIAEVFAAAADKLSPQIAEKKLSIRTEAPDEGLKAEANYDWLLQVMINLMENAVKYSPEGGEILLSCRRADARARIIVKDGGGGIAPQDLPFVFDRFYRADKSRSRSVGGSGIGLSLARLIVETLGGKISVRSKVNEGAEFTIYLPLAKE